MPGHHHPAPGFIVISPGAFDPGIFDTRAGSTRALVLVAVLVGTFHNGGEFVHSGGIVFGHNRVALCLNHIILLIVAVTIQTL
ncbi:hypothetical protein D3C71_1296030 [compost metagenome]